MKKLSFSLFLLVGLSCNNQFEFEEQRTIQLLDAPQAIKAEVGNFLTATSNTNRLSVDSRLALTNFPVQHMKEILISIEDKQNSVYGIASNYDESIVLTFKLNDHQEIESFFFTENVLNEDGSVDTKFYSENGILGMHFTTYNDRVTYHEVNTPFGGRTQGWFDDTGDCVSEVAKPFDNGVLNLAFDVAATYATGGWYPVVLLGACGIYAAL